MGQLIPAAGKGAQFRVMGGDQAERPRPFQGFQDLRGSGDPLDSVGSPQHLVNRAEHIPVLFLFIQDALEGSDFRDVVAFPCQQVVREGDGSIDPEKAAPVVLTGTGTDRFRHERAKYRRTEVSRFSGRIGTRDEHGSFEFQVVRHRFIQHRMHGLLRLYERPVSVIDDFRLTPGLQPGPVGCDRSGSIKPADGLVHGQEVFVILRQLSFQDLKSDQVREKEADHGILERIRVDFGDDRSGTEDRFYPVQVPVRFRQVPVQLRIPPFPDFPQGKGKHHAVVDPPDLRFTPLAAHLMDKVVDRHEHNRDNSKLYVQQKYRGNGKKEQQAHGDVDGGPEQGCLPGPEIGRHVHIAADAGFVQQKLELQPDIRMVLQEMNDPVVLPVSLPVHRPAEQIIQVLFPRRALAGIDPLVHLVQVQVLPGGFIHIKLIPPLSPAGVEPGTDPVHITRIIVFLRFFPERVLQLPYQLSVFPQHHLFPSPPARV